MPMGRRATRTVVPCHAATDTGQREPAGLSNGLDGSIAPMAA